MAIFGQYNWAIRCFQYFVLLKQCFSCRATEKNCLFPTPINGNFLFFKGDCTISNWLILAELCGKNVSHLLAILITPFDYIYHITCFGNMLLNKNLLSNCVAQLFQLNVVVIKFDKLILTYCSIVLPEKLPV